MEDPRGDTLKRGTTVTLVLKEEAYDYLEQDTVKDLIKKYSQFINFNIYMWTSKTETVEEPDEEAEEEAAEKPETEDEPVKEEDEDAAVEEEKEDEEKKPKTKKVQKTTWDWELINDHKPIWTRKPAEVEDEEYQEFYKVCFCDVFTRNFLFTIYHCFHEFFSSIRVSPKTLQMPCHILILWLKEKSHLNLYYSYQKSNRLKVSTSMANRLIILNCMSEEFSLLTTSRI